MWWIIILGLIVFVMIKFASDNHEQSSAVAKQGGMRKKYKRLVDFVLAGNEKAQIMREDGTSLTVGCVSPGVSTYFDIIQGFGDVEIIWHTKSVIMGNHKLKWNFNEFYDQDKMIEKINHDIEAYFSNCIQNFS